MIEYLPDGDGSGESFLDILTDYFDAEKTEADIVFYEPSKDLRVKGKAHPAHLTIDKANNKLIVDFGEEEPDIPDIDVFKGPVRVAGDTRYTTSRMISSKLKEVLGTEKFSAAVISTGANFPDALAGGYLANINDAPILMISAGSKDDADHADQCASSHEHNLIAIFMRRGRLLRCIRQQCLLISRSKHLI